MQKMVSFPEPLVKVLEKKADIRGISFSRYLQFLALKDTEETFDRPVKILPMDDEMAAEVLQARKEIAEGKGVEFDPSNKKELEEALS